MITMCHVKAASSDNAEVITVDNKSTATVTPKLSSAVKNRTIITYNNGKYRLQEVAVKNEIPVSKTQDLSLIHSFANKEGAAEHGVTDTQIEDAIISVPDVTDTQIKYAKSAHIGISVAKTFANIRKEATGKSEVIGKLYKNSAAVILGAENGWYYIESGNVKGYVKTKYIDSSISYRNLITKYASMKAKLTCNSLALREDTSTSSDKLTTLSNDKTYKATEIHNKWVKIDTNNNDGYIPRKYAFISIDFNDAVSKEEETALLRKKAEELRKQAEESISGQTKLINRNAIEYTDEDLKLLTCLVQSEAGGETFEGKLAVANIVINRVFSSKYADTFKGVIYQPGQFSVVRNGSMNRQLNNYGSSSQFSSNKAAKSALSGVNNIGDRLYFHAYSTAIAKGYNNKPSCVKVDHQLFW